MYEPIDPHRSALIVIDMQNDFVQPGAPMAVDAAPEILGNVSRCLEFARDTGAQVDYTVHTHRRDGSDLGTFGRRWPALRDGRGLVEGTPGADVCNELAPNPGEHVVKKHRYSAFFGTELDVLLRGAHIENVIITGVATENCCHATARDAMFRDYRVVFVADATGTSDRPDFGRGPLDGQAVHEMTLSLLAQSTADVVSTNELLSLCS